MNEVEINPQMVVLAREIRGLSQKELAEKLQTSPSYICKMETDVRTITEETLAKICRLLKFLPSFFYHKGEAYLPMSLNYRKRDHVSAKAVSEFEANVNLYRLHAETILEKIKLKEANIPFLDLLKFNSEEEVAKQLRKYWQMPKGPVENLAVLLEKNGIIVISFDFGTERIDSRTIHTKDKHSIIVINKNHRADRQRFSLAYELGYLVMHSGILPSHKRDIGHEANKFAAGFLLPEKEIKKDFSFKEGITIALLGELKRKWKVSMIALLHRADDLGFVTKNQKQYLLQQFNTLRIRRREPVELDFPQEKPTLLRDLITKYKNAHKFSAKELAASLHLEVEEFMQRYN